MRMPFNDTHLRKDSREAADAGLLIWRKNFPAFIPFFAVPFALLAILLRIILPEDFLYLSWIIIWLLKPFFDRLILHVISIRFFNKNAQLNQLLQGLGKTIFRGLAGDLFWRRLSPYRCALMPVRVLEININTPAKFKERKKDLEKGGLGFCVFLTIWGIMAETALLAGGAGFSLSILELFTGQLIFLLDNLKYIEIILFTAWCINLILVESIYVCMGFSLYINSRTETEGWDIQIIFKNIAEKLKNAKNPVLIILFITFFSIPVISYAGDFTAQEPGNKAPLETLNKILDSPEFGSVEETWGIRFKNESLNEEEIITEEDQLTHIQRIFAYILRLFLFVIITALVIFLLFYLYKNKEKILKKNKNHSEYILNSNSAFDHKLLLEKAVGLYKQGELRLAWGYCTASSIQLWSSYTGTIFPANATENDCIELIKKTNGVSSYNDFDLNKTPPLQTQAQELEKLIKTWIQFAYAGHIPTDKNFNEAVNFCVTLETSGGSGAENG